MKRHLLLLILISNITLLFAATINAGTYSVKSGGDYSNLAVAISALNTNGITGNGNVIFEIGENQSLSSQIINDISGADASNQIYFRPESGVNPTITINLSSSGSSGILFNGTDYITFDGWDQQGSVNRDMTVTISTYNGNVFEFKDATDCDFITIKNCNILGNTNSTSANNACIYYYDSSSDGHKITHINIDNNYIYKNAYGIRLDGKLSDGNNYLDITNNEIGPTTESSTNNITIAGIKATQFAYANILNNEITNVKYLGGTNYVNGIWVETIDSLICDTNNIHDIVASRGAWAIKIRAFGYSGTKGYRISRNTINEIHTTASGAAGTDAAGICYSILVSNGLITDNTISDIYCDNATGSPAAIGTWAVGSLQNITISKNKISRIYNTTIASDSYTAYSGRGIYFNGTLVKNVIIVNNFIYAIGGASNLSSSAYNSTDFNESYPYGIFINTSSATGTAPQIKIYHNSVYMTEDAKSDASQTGYPLNSAVSCFSGAIGINSSRTNFIDMRNNIFYNLISPVHTNQFKPQYAVLVYNTANPFFNSDYNIYKMERHFHNIWCKNRDYVAAVNGGSTTDARPISDSYCDGGAGSSTYGSGCSNWQGFTGNDVHSITHNVTFTCSYPATVITDSMIYSGIGDLHIDVGDAIDGANLGITEDGDGDTRTSPYSIGADQGVGNILPIKLLDFTAKEDDNNVKIEWITLSESNNDFFTVEKSRDGLNWSKLVELDGAGNSSNRLFYSTIEYKPFIGVTYYRLKQTDFDGRYYYSEIRTVKIIKNTKTEVLVYPNPTGNILTIESNLDELSQIQVLNLIGEDLLPEINLSKISDTKTQIDLSSLPKGVYLLKTKTIASKVFKR